jgi:hypothetical protein
MINDELTQIFNIVTVHESPKIMTERNTYIALFGIQIEYDDCYDYNGDLIDPKDMDTEHWSYFVRTTNGPRPWIIGNDDEIICYDRKNLTQSIMTSKIKSHFMKCVCDHCHKKIDYDVKYYYSDTDAHLCGECAEHAYIQTSLKYPKYTIIGFEYDDPYLNKLLLLDNDETNKKFIEWYLSGTTRWDIMGKIREQEYSELTHYDCFHPIEDYEIEHYTLKNADETLHLCHYCGEFLELTILYNVKRVIWLHDVLPMDVVNFVYKIITSLNNIKTLFVK